MQKGCRRVAEGLEGSDYFRSGWNVDVDVDVWVFRFSWVLARCGILPSLCLVRPYGGRCLMRRLLRCGLIIGLGCLMVVLLRLSIAVVCCVAVICDFILVSDSVTGCSTRL